MRHHHHLALTHDVVVTLHHSDEPRRDHDRDHDRLEELDRDRCQSTDCGMRRHDDPMLRPV